MAATMVILLTILVGVTSLNADREPREYSERSEPVETDSGAEEQMFYPHTYRQNIKRMLPQTLLRQRFLPKLKFSNPVLAPPRKDRSKQLPRAGSKVSWGLPSNSRFSNPALATARGDGGKQSKGVLPSLQYFRFLSATARNLGTRLGHAKPVPTPPRSQHGEVGKVSGMLGKIKLPDLKATPLSLSSVKPNYPNLAAIKQQWTPYQPSGGTNVDIPTMLGISTARLPQSRPIRLMHYGQLRSEVCRAESYNRTITSEGCKPLVIESKYCSGRCNSFYVPSEKADFQSCSSCFPTVYRSVMVALKCPGRKRGYQVKLIRVIKSCDCKSVTNCIN